MAPPDYGSITKHNDCELECCANNDDDDDDDEEEAFHQAQSSTATMTDTSTNSYSNSGDGYGCRDGCCDETENGGGCNDDCCDNDDNGCNDDCCDDENCKNDEGGGRGGGGPITNVYVLNVAFLSFVGFTMFQAIFAIIARSESMLADTEAMFVDAFTYLCNLLAERIKNRPPTPEELELPLAVREHRMEMKRLYLELFPPLISVIALIFVTIGALNEASETLFGVDVETGEEQDDDDDVDAGIMLLFSGLNLLLDVVNVTCFARAQKVFGWPLDEILNVTCTCFAQAQQQLKELRQQQQQQQSLYDTTNGSSYDESTELVGNDHDLKGNIPIDTASKRRRSTRGGDQFQSWFGRLNLNMCSAWTHLVAETMRTTAVLIAAAIACTFEAVTPAAADACAAIVVSITILISLIPLVGGLLITARQLVIESRNKPSFTMET